MDNIKLTLRLIGVSLKVVFKRLFGIKKYPQWSLQTELMWATTRTTLLSSNDFGLPWLKSMSEKFVPKPKLAKEVEIEELENEWGKYLSIRPHNSNETDDKVIIYFHGGGYVIGSPKTAIEFTTRLSIATGSSVHSPFYPQAPDHSYPAAQEFAGAFVKKSIRNNPNKKIILAGDSAGAALVLIAYLQLEAQQKQSIEACVLISPWIDPLADGGSIQSNANNDVGDRDFVVACYDLYVGDKKEDNTLPLSMLDIDLGMIPSTFISVGGAEILLDQSKALADKLKHAGTKVDLKIYQDMFHTFWNMAPTIAEANTLLTDIAAWLEQHTVVKK